MSGVVWQTRVCPYVHGMHIAEEMTQVCAASSKRKELEYKSSDEPHEEQRHFTMK